ncbi:MAG: homoserine kinase [Coriobacteriia bacterium]|nr:homoserine kinase [Coriobacteriia bacterium]
MAHYGYAIPATSANLGPGFDSFGIALDLFNKFEAQRANAWTVHVEGEGKGYLFEDERNQVARAMKMTFDSLDADLSAEVWCENRIPTGNGLGSSSTARLGGVLLARDIAEEAGYRRLSDQEVFEIASRLEGHPDNVAPAFFGGFTVCWMSDDVPQHARFEPANGLAAVVVPALGEVSTRESRKMLPDDVPHRHAAFNVAHAGLLAASIVAGHPEHFGAALKDKLHEPYRSASIVDLEQIHTILMEAGADGVALSGSGPTVIGLVDGTDDQEAYRRAVEIASKASEAVHALKTRREPLPLSIVREGVKQLHER